MLHSRFGVAARRRRLLDSLVRHVAESSVEAVCQLVAERVRAMSPCEARGYVRARAGAEIRRQARLSFMCQPGLDAAWESLVVFRAAERIAPLALKRLSAQKCANSSTALRRAA